MDFKDGKQSTFFPDALLVVKDARGFSSEIKKEPSSLTLNDFKDLYKMSLLADRGRDVDTWQALEIAQKNPSIRNKILNPLDSQISVGYSYSR